MTARKQALIVGLGNPGKRYAMTRHNIGFLIVSAFAEAQGWAFKEEPRFQAETATGRLAACAVHLLKPLTYMNRSGWAVKRYMDYYRLSPNDLIVVVDDMALSFGAMRVRERGSPGGHNGLKSLQAHLGTSDYVRLRIGIAGQEGSKRIESAAYADHVLGSFDSGERRQLEEILPRGAKLLERLAAGEVKEAMNEVNRKVKNQREEIIHDEPRKTNPL